MSHPGVDPVALEISRRLNSSLIVDMIPEAMRDGGCSRRISGIICFGSRGVSRGRPNIKYPHSRPRPADIGRWSHKVELNLLIARHLLRCLYSVPSVACVNSDLRG